jgi:hypothetical protein
MSTPQFVGIQPDGAGKKIQVFENTVSGQVVEAQAVVAVDAGSGNPMGLPASADNLPISQVAVEAPGVYNGVGMDRWRGASAAGQSAGSGLGVGIVTGPGTWSVFAQATAGTPSAVKAVGAAGVRHVLTSVSISVAAAGTAQPAVIVNLLDGVTVIRSWALACPINSGQAIDLADLNIVGSAATSMTLQFAGATAAAVVGSVNFSGYDVA